MTDASVSDRAPTISAAYVRAVLDAVESLGLPREDLLAAAGLSEAGLAEPEGRVALPAYRALTREARRRSTDAALGLEIGLRLRLSAAAPVFQAAISVATLRDALAVVARYSALLAEGSSVAVAPEPGGGIRICQRFRRDQVPTTPVDVDIAAVLALRFVRGVVGLPIRPVEVHLDYRRPAAVRGYREVFQCPVYFDSDEACLVLSPRDAAAETQAADPVLAERLRAFLDRQMAALHQQRTLPGAVRLAIQRAIGPELPRVDRIARSLGLSVRSLQRQLAGAGTTYSRLLDEAVRDAALERLRADGETIEEIGYLHGFASPAAFSHAVHRWSGLSPLAYRRKHKASR